MKPVRMLIAGLALGVVSQAALAFQEAGTTKGDAAAQVGVEAKVSGQDAKGPEIRIPGLGAVGSLPKLDFGLELLYGATEQRTTREDKTEPNDVQIRGTLKYRFPN
ncbi:MAG: hypothetical protein HOO99_18820 [Hyphomicrobiaceae bacterium]|nr:hypothetical protein [Hyphomicrobiaceae bacterium]